MSEPVRNLLCFAGMLHKASRTASHSARRVDRSVRNHASSRYWDHTRGSLTKTAESPSIRTGMGCTGSGTADPPCNVLHGRAGWKTQACLNESNRTAVLSRGTANNMQSWAKNNSKAVMAQRMRLRPHRDPARTTTQEMRNRKLLHSTCE